MRGTAKDKDVRCPRRPKWILRAAPLFVLGLTVEAARALPRDTPTALHPEGSVGTEPVHPLGTGRYSLGLMLSLESKPFRIPEATDHPALLVHQRWVTDVSMVVGWHRRASFGLSVPLLLHQRFDQDTAAVSQGLGAPLIRHKLSVIERGQLGGFGLSLLNSVSLPLGPRRGWIDQTGPAVGATVLSELRLVVLVLRAQAGMLLREPETRFGSRLGSELPLALSVEIKPQLFGLDESGRWLLHLHSKAALALSGGLGSRPWTRTSVGAVVRARLADFALSLGSELPLGSGRGLPRPRVSLGLSYTPSHFDADGDSISDDDDFCPAEPEDYDGDVDEDGCPETDEDPALGI